MTILVGLDSSSLSRQALAMAINIALKTKTSIRLVHVIDLAGSTPFIPGEADTRSVLHRLEEEGRKLLADSEQMCKEAGVECQPPQMPHGRVSDCLLANLAGISMVCLGHRGIKSYLLTSGSVAEEILKVAEVPLLTIRSTGENEGQWQAITRILISIDGSDYGFLALKKSIPLVKAFSAQLSAIHVASHGASHNAEKEQMAKRVREIALENSLEIDLSITESTNDPAAMIIDASRGFDLIIAACHCRTSLVHAVFGSSVTEAIMRESKVPVLAYGLHSLTI